MDLKTYQALASQLEQIADLLIQDHADRLRFRNEVLRRLNESDSTRRSEPSDTFLTKSQAKTLWSAAKTVGPWALTAGIGLFHLLAHYLGHH
jgi:hypothetical protein